MHGGVFRSYFLSFRWFGSYVLLQLQYPYLLFAFITGSVPICNTSTSTNTSHYITLPFRDPLDLDTFF
jgi:hypothetical protein